MIGYLPQIKQETQIELTEHAVLDVVAVKGRLGRFLLSLQI